MDDTAVVTWAKSGSDDFEPCRDGIDAGQPGTDFDCGPDDDDASGDFVVRVEWNGETFEEEVSIESDSTCLANADVRIGESEDSGS